MHPTHNLLNKNIRNIVLPTKPPLSWFLQGFGFNPTSPMLFGNVAVQKVAPSFLVSTFCPSIMPPSAARRPASTSISPWARVSRSRASSFFFWPLLR